MGGYYWERSAVQHSRPASNLHFPTRLQSLVHTGRAQLQSKSHPACGPHNNQQPRRRKPPLPNPEPKPELNHHPFTNMGSLVGRCSQRIEPSRYLVVPSDRQNTKGWNSVVSCVVATLMRAVFSRDLSRAAPIDVSLPVPVLSSSPETTMLRCWDRRCRTWTCTPYLVSCTQ